MIPRGLATGALRQLRCGLGVQRAYAAGIRRLTAEYVTAMLAGARGSEDPPPAAAGDPPRFTSTADADATDAGDAGALILEGETGAMATARFLVENHLDQPISAPVCVSPFTSQSGHTADLTLRFAPALVTLQPHEQLLVSVATRIDGQLADGGSYWGVLGVPDLPGTELAVLVRHRAAPGVGTGGERLETRRAAGQIPLGART